MADAPWNPSNIEHKNGDFIKRTPVEKRLADDGLFCLSERGLKSLSQEWFRQMTLQTPWGREKRTFCPVSLSSGMFYADVKTGTLYGTDGRSVSGSPLSIRVRS